MVLLQRICNVLGMTPDRHGRLYGPSCALIGAVVTSLAWIAVGGLPLQWHSQTSNTNGEETIVANADPSTPAEAAKSKLPAEANEQDTRRNEVAVASNPLTLENLKFNSYWDLSLDEAVGSAMVNSKVIRSLGGSFTNGEAQMPTLESTAEVSPADFELAVLNLRSDTEQAYWELAFAWRNLESCEHRLAHARKTWRKVVALECAGSKSGEAKAVAQAREQFYQFNARPIRSSTTFSGQKTGSATSWARRPPTAGWSAPIDKPTVAKVDFDWKEITKEALAHSPDIRRQKWNIKRREMELIAAKNLLLPRLDVNGTYRWLGLGDPFTPPIPLALTGSSGLQTLASGQFQEWQMGIQSTLRIGFRKELAHVRHYQLQVVRRAGQAARQRSWKSRISSPTPCGNWC